MTTSAMLTLQDIADLAHVRRPVVSMWRRRPRARGGIESPFPALVLTSGGVDWFDRNEVVAWLETTQRGNNIEARQDAPALTVPAGASFDDVCVLLCLHALTAEELSDLSLDQLVALAEHADPNDQLLLREVRALADVASLQRYVDDLVEASFGLGDALSRAEGGRLRREAAARGLNDEVTKLLQAVANACRLHLGGEDVAIVPHNGQPLAIQLSDGFAGLMLDDDALPCRSHRRRARLLGVDVVEAARSAVRVLSVVGEDPTAALDAVDDLELSLGPSDVGIVLGPAAVLCDRLTSDAEQRRAQTLRSRKLALAMRLSRGQWKGAHRQHLSIWVLAGDRSAESLYIADLDGLSVELDDLAADVTAALQLTEKRAYRYARTAPLAPVLAGTVPVVPRGVRAVHVGTGRSSHLEEILAATLATSSPIRGFDLTAAAAPARIVLRRRSLRELADAGQLSVKRGARIDLNYASPTGTRRVLVADGSFDHLRFDPLDAERLYPRAAVTEPGDVVFTQHPRPAARVDEDGGALVMSPSKIIRLAPTALIGAYVLAALINEEAPPGTDWETWSVPELPEAESRALDGALKDAAGHLAELHKHEVALRDLTKNLIQGVAAGTVTLDPAITQRTG